MGHRANFVVIEDRAARVFADSWAALTCALVLREGPAASRKWAEKLSEADGLMPSAIAEAGVLLDFDEAVMNGGRPRPPARRQRPRWPQRLRRSANLRTLREA